MNLAAQSDGFLSTPIHWTRQCTFYCSFTSDDYSFPLCQLGQKISYLYSLHFIQRLRAFQAQSQLRWFPPCSTCSPAQGSRNDPSVGNRWTPKQEMTMFPCCPPVAMPWPVSRSGTSLKSPLFLIWRLSCLRSPSRLFSLLTCSCVYQDNWWFYVKGARMHF